MSRTISVGAAILLGALAFAVWLHFHDQAVRADAAQVQHDVVLDSVIRARQISTRVDSLKLERQRDSTGRVIQNLQRRIREVRPTAPNAGNPSPGTGAAVASGASASACAGAPAQCDTLIAALTAGRTQDSLQILFWRGAVAQRDSVITALQQARNTWRDQAQRRFACGVGVGVTVGLDGRAAVGPSVGCYYKL